MRAQVVSVSTFNKAVLLWFEWKDLKFQTMVPLEADLVVKCRCAYQINVSHSVYER